MGCTRWIMCSSEMWQCVGCSTMAKLYRLAGGMYRLGVQVYCSFFSFAGACRDTLQFAAFVVLCVASCFVLVLLAVIGVPHSASTQCASYCTLRNTGRSDCGTSWRVGRHAQG